MRTKRSDLLSHLSFIVASLTLALLSVPVLSQEPKLPTDEEIREAKVYEAIADMVSRREELLRGKFAVVLYGESIKLGHENGILQTPHLYGRVVDGKRSFDLKFEYLALGTEDLGYEVVRTGTKYKSREMERLFVGDYINKPEGERLSEWQGKYQGAGHDPYDDYLTGANNFTSGLSYRQIESTVLKRYNLSKTERGTGDRLVSYWNYHPVKGFNARVRIELDPAAEMMPVRHSLENIDNKKDFQEMRIDWAKHGEFVLPNRIELAHGSMGQSGETTEYTFKCHWLVGDEVPDTIFTAKDHLAALMDHLKIPHATVVNGERINAVHVLPEDLYEDKEK